MDVLVFGPVTPAACVNFKKKSNYFNFCENRLLGRVNGSTS